LSDKARCQVNRKSSKSAIRV